MLDVIIAQSSVLPVWLEYSEIQNNLEMNLAFLLTD